MTERGTGTTVSVPRCIFQRSAPGRGGTMETLERSAGVRRGARQCRHDRSTIRWDSPSVPPDEGSNSHSVSCSSRAWRTGLRRTQDLHHRRHGRRGRRADRGAVDRRQPAVRPGALSVGSTFSVLGFGSVGAHLRHRAARQSDHDRLGPRLSHLGARPARRCGWRSALSRDAHGAHRRSRRVAARSLSAVRWPIGVATGLADPQRLPARPRLGRGRQHLHRRRHRHRRRPERSP